MPAAYSSNRPDSQQDALNPPGLRSNTLPNRQNSQQPRPTDLPYAFAAQFESIQRQEISLTQRSDPRVSIALPDETHRLSDLASRPPHIQRPPRQPHPQANGTVPIIRTSETPDLQLVNIMPTPQRPARSSAQLQQRSELRRTSSHLPDSAGWSQEMSMEAIGMLETESIEGVLEHFVSMHPHLRDLQAIREHLQALVIQFHG